MNKLAIIIPAYKADFLNDTLSSLANQTNKNFNIYIGDDASPYDVFSVIRQFEERLNITYKRFQENLGGTNLVSHWKRCIELSTEEVWIWLFSDDDVMDEKCVESFYQHIEKESTCELVHFDVKVIDANGSLLERFTSKFESFPKRLPANQFFKFKVNGSIQSYVVEYVFKRELYCARGGFVNFDLAWCADDATWINFVANDYISTVENAYVYWRYSGSNISSINTSYSILNRKLSACLSFLDWTEQFFDKNRIYDICTEAEKTKWLLENFKSAPVDFKYKYRNLNFIKQCRKTNTIIWIKSFLRIVIAHLRILVIK